MAIVPASTADRNKVRAINFSLKLELAGPTLAARVIRLNMRGSYAVARCTSKG
jgi:hypothetical protein